MEDGKACPNCHASLIVDKLASVKFCGSCGFAESYGMPQDSRLTQKRADYDDKKIGKSPCKSVCLEFKAIKPVSEGRYASGQVRCMICDIFMRKDGCVDKYGKTAAIDTMGLFCKCCGYRVRTKPRANVYKQKLAQSTT